MQNFHQFSNAGQIFVAFFYYNYVAVCLSCYGFCILCCQSVILCQLILQRIVCIDCCEAQIAQGQRQLCSFHFNDFQIIGVFCDIQLCCSYACIGIQLNQTICFQKQQRTTAVCSVIGDTNLCAGGDILQILYSAGIDAHGFKMNLANCYQMRALFLIELFQIRGVLEVVCIQITGFCCQVRLYIICKFNDIQLDAFLCQFILCCIQDFSMGCGRSTDFQCDFLFVAVIVCCCVIRATASCQTNSQHTCQ